MPEIKIYEEKITISDALIQKFADFSGDFNPVHFDDKAAREAGFKGRIAHGMLTSSYFSYMFVRHFPGPGSIYLSQTFKFHLPIFANETVNLRIELISQKEGKPIYTLKTEAIGEDGSLKISGEAVVKGSGHPLQA